MEKSIQENLAEEITQLLDDRDNLKLYRSYTERYPEVLLRKFLDEVMNVPIEKIRKSRGALFTYLIQKYGHRTNHNHRH